MLLLYASAAGGERPESTCFGTRSNGRLAHGWKLPFSGDNFRAYSRLGATVGRTFVHSSVHRVVLDAYATLAQSEPETQYVYGETGWSKGGQFRPHRTHQNGLSVDFMVPVVDASGRSVPLPANALNKYGYGVDFDARGRFEGLRIDFTAILRHLRALFDASAKRGIEVELVIFDPKLQSHLRSDPAWPTLSKDVRFSKNPVWVRHDDHYHIDFATRCGPL